MTVPKLHPDDGYLLDYATGALSEPFAALIASHLTFCPACRDTVRAFEGIGGAFLDASEPVAMSAESLAAVMQRLDRPLTVMTPPSLPLSGFGYLPRPLQRFLSEMPERPHWRRAFFGLETVRIPRFGECRSRLMRIAPSRAMPRHTHSGNELLLVLQGSYTDHTGVYERGDVAYGDPELVHQPRAASETGCVCFSVWDAPPRMVGLLAPLLNRLLPDLIRRSISEDPMRAIICRTLGDPSLLAFEELPAPILGAGQLRIAIRAAGVNFADSLIIAGKYQEKPLLPFIPGFELAGLVTEIGDGVTGFALGDRVMALTGAGGYADEVVVGTDAVFKIPDAMSFEQAAGFPIAYGTSHGALDWKARLKPGEILLVHGAAGGVGLTAVEIGKAMGAIVIAVAGSPAKLDIARSRGADHLIDSSSEDVPSRVKALLGERRVDVAYDPVGGEAFEACLRTIAWEGRILVIGFAGGTVPQIPANILLVKNCDVLGFYWSSYRTRRADLFRRSFETLLGWVAAGVLHPLISETLPLDRAAEAIERLKARQVTGKLVLTIAD